MDGGLKASPFLFMCTFFIIWHFEDREIVLLINGGGLWPPRFLFGMLRGLLYKKTMEINYTPINSTKVLKNQSLMGGFWLIKQMRLTGKCLRKDCTFWGKQRLYTCNNRSLEPYLIFQYKCNFQLMLKYIKLMKIY